MREENVPIVKAHQLDVWGSYEYRSNKARCTRCVGTSGILQCRYRTSFTPGSFLLETRNYAQMHRYPWSREQLNRQRSQRSSIPVAFDLEEKRKFGKFSPNLYGYTRKGPQTIWYPVVSHVFMEAENFENMARSVTVLCSTGSLLIIHHNQVACEQVLASNKTKKRTPIGNFSRSVSLFQLHAASNLDSRKSFSSV